VFEHARPSRRCALKTGCRGSRPGAVEACPCALAEIAAEDRRRSDVRDRSHRGRLHRREPANGAYRTRSRRHRGKFILRRGAAIGRSVNTGHRPDKSPGGSR
jgi:hypothetical protein